MTGINEMNAGGEIMDADRLFKEDAARRYATQDGRLVRWLKPPAPGSRAELVSSLFWTAFGVFCIVGGLAMMLGMGFLPAMGVSLVVFAMLRIFMNVG
jgi:hypothetical protein